ncbi:MAG: hypothetical protein GY900_12485 [Actinomycetia bacterium]|jgi:hypothetical protein|nr:hypothetical protein [Actinomycetales bacterium]MCP4852532.1 hypothetical protein [Actinomycetes bacterium]
MSRPEPKDLSTLVHEERRSATFFRSAICKHCGEHDPTGLCLGRIEQERRAAFEAGYDWGYGNGHVDGLEEGRFDDPEFNAAPGESYDLWLGADELPQGREE